METLPWAVRCDGSVLSSSQVSSGVIQFSQPSTSSQSSSSKRPRRQSIFSGKSCFLINGSILALDYGDDIYALTTLLFIDNGQLLCEFRSEREGQNKVLFYKIDHRYIRFIRRSRPSRRTVKPANITLDFGHIGLRLWCPESSEFATDLLSAMEEGLSRNPSEKASFAKDHVVHDWSDEVVIEVLQNSLDQMEKAICAGDAHGYFGSVSEFIRTAHISKQVPRS